jgi:hypothetical protein
MKINKITLSILVGLLFLITALVTTNAQYITPEYGMNGAGGLLNGPYSVNTPASAAAPYTTDLPAGTTIPAAANMPTGASMPYAANMASPYAAASPYTMPYASSCGVPYGADVPYGGPIVAPLAGAPCAAPLVAPMVAPFASPIVASPLTGGFTYSNSQSSAFGPFSPPVSQASEQFYQYPGLTPFGAYPGTGYAATGGVGFDPVSGYYGPYGGITPL